MNRINLVCTIKTPGGETLTITREDLEEMAGVMRLELFDPDKHLRIPLVYQMESPKPGSAFALVPFYGPDITVYDVTGLAGWDRAMRAQKHPDRRVTINRTEAIRALQDC